MGAFVGGLTSTITWAGTQNTRLVVTAAKPASFRLNLQGQEFDNTNFDAAGISTHVKGLSSWNGSISLQLATAQTGDLGTVVYSAGYVANLDAWTMDIATEFFETTPKDQAVTNTARWRTYLPGKLSWGGTFSGYIDDSTTLKWPANSSEPGTGTFTLRSATTHTFAGSIFTTRLDADVPQAAATANYAYRGSGALTESDASDTLELFTLGGGAVARPSVGELVLTAVNGQTFTGDAFWTAVRISTPVNGMTTVDIDFQGTDDLAAG